MTWTQLGLHAKPCGLLNVDGYYDALLAFLAHARAEQFLPAHHTARSWCRLRFGLLDAAPAAARDRPGRRWTPGLAG